MPLDHGKSKEAFSRNVATEMKAGKPQKQAVAIAYKTRGDAEKPEYYGQAWAKGARELGKVGPFPNREEARDEAFKKYPKALRVTTHRGIGAFDIRNHVRGDAEGDNSDDVLDRVLAQCEKMDAQLTEIEKHCDAVEGKRFDAQKGSYGDAQEGDGGEDSGFYIAEPKADVEQSVPPNASPEEKAIVKEHNEIDAKRVKILNEIASEWNNRPKGEKDDGAMWKRHEALKRKEVAPLIKRQKDLQDKLLTAIRARLARKDAEKGFYVAEPKGDAINSSSPPKPSKSEWKGHKYDPIGVQEQINKDKRIKPGEAKRIHSLLRGWRNDGEPAEIIDELVSERRGDDLMSKLDTAIEKCDFMGARLADAARRMDAMNVRNTLTHRTYSSSDPKGSHLSAAR